jgi:hypothetical protein
MGERDEGASNQDEDDEVVEVGTEIPAGPGRAAKCVRLGRLDHSWLTSRSAAARITVSVKIYL